MGRIEGYSARYQEEPVSIPEINSLIQKKFQRFESFDSQYYPTYDTVVFRS